VRKADKFVDYDFSKVDKRIKDIQTLIDNQDYVSYASTDNDTKDRTPGSTDSKRINANIRMSEQQEEIANFLDQQTPCKSEKLNYDVIKSSQEDDAEISEFEDEASCRDPHPQSQLIYSTAKSQATKRPFNHKTPSPENAAPLKMKFDLGKLAVS